LWKELEIRSPQPDEENKRERENMKMKNYVFYKST